MLYLLRPPINFGFFGAWVHYLSFIGGNGPKKLDTGHWIAHFQHLKGSFFRPSFKSKQIQYPSTILSILRQRRESPSLTSPLHSPSPTNLTITPYRFLVLKKSENLYRIFSGLGKYHQRRISRGRCWGKARKSTIRLINQKRVPFVFGKFTLGGYKVICRVYGVVQFVNFTLWFFFFINLF